MRTRIAALFVAVLLLGFAAVTPGVRRRFIQDIITWDAPAAETAKLPVSPLPGPMILPGNRVRVVVIDGLGREAAQRLPTWSSLCGRGLRLTVDVGFPTVSLPVQVSLWTGLTQQQTGVMFRSDRPIVPPLGRRGMPSKIASSIAIAEHHGYIVRSLGFAVVEPAAAEGASGRDREPDAWAKVWQARAVEAVASAAQLAFVHVLRVDTWGHRKGGASPEYAQAAAESDAILAQLHAAAPDALWFLLSDHGHLPKGGHGGEERAVRQVEHCIVGPAIAPGTGGPVHLVDVSHALADALRLTLDPRSPGRSLASALNAPLDGDEAVPALALGRGAIAGFLLILGLAATAWGVRRHWWLAPWWFVIACVALVVWRGVPTMSMPMVYAKEDIGDLFDGGRRLMMRTWLPFLPLAIAAVWFGLGRIGYSALGLARVLVAQLAVPSTALAAALTTCGGWRPLFGAEVSPMVPHYTAFTLVLMVIVAQGAAAVALAVLARTALLTFGRPRSSETTRSATRVA